MATFTLMKDEMKTCPYNPLHKVSSRRLQAHIVKCSRNPANPVLVDCPFNALHRLAPEELQQHILVCKDSRQVIREFGEARTRPAVNKALIPRTEVPISSEDWDNEIDKDAKTYVIPGLIREDNGWEEGTSDKPFQILSNIQIQALKPSDRKKYYKVLAEKAKSQDLPQTKTDLRIKEETERATTSSVSQYVAEEDDDNPNNVRNPNTNPFKKKMTGIGRGNTPLPNRSVSNSMREVGSSPSPFGPTVKRETDDEVYNRAKRFSPEIPF